VQSRTKTSCVRQEPKRRLEALAVHNRWAGLVVLLLGDPHLLEGGEGGQDGATDPDGVLALRGGDDLDLHGGRRERGELLLHAVRNAGEHGGATGQDGVAVEILADIDVALHDGVVGGLMDTGFEIIKFYVGFGSWSISVSVAVDFAVVVVVVEEEVTSVVAARLLCFLVKEFTSNVEKLDVRVSPVFDADNLTASPSS